MRIDSLILICFFGIYICLHHDISFLLGLLRFF